MGRSSGTTPNWISLEKMSKEKEDGKDERTVNRDR